MRVVVAIKIGQSVREDTHQLLIMRKHAMNSVVVSPSLFQVLIFANAQADVSLADLWLERMAGTSANTTLYGMPSIRSPHRTPPAR